MSAAAATQARQTVAPDIVTLPSLPVNVYEKHRLITTPRARITLGPKVSDPAEVVRRSGRQGCVFSLRSLVAGVVECLLPGGGFFNGGAPMFRVYDPAVLEDLRAAEQALQQYDVEPLLIGRSPGRRATVRGSGISAPRDFPDPLRSATARSRPLLSPTTVPPVASAPRPRPALSAQPRPATPKPATKPRLKPAAPLPPLVDLGPFEEAVADAQAKVADAQSALQARQQDFDAKKKLVELGALAQDSLDESASMLRDATMARGDAEAALSNARDMLASQREKAAKARAARESALASHEQSDEGAPQVEVVLGGASPDAPGHSAQPSGALSMEAGVQVIRGGAGAQAPSPQSARASQQRATSGAEPPWRHLRPITPEQSRPMSRPAEYDADELEPSLVTTRFLPLPKELGALSDQRWTEYQAPAEGFVLKQAVSDGQLIEAGQELATVINTQWTVAQFRVTREQAPRFEPGTLVLVDFEGYPGARFEGWVESVDPLEDADGLRVQIIVFCREGYFGTDAFATLHWLALATPLDAHGEPDPVEPLVEDSAESQYERDPSAGLAMVPRDIWALSVDESDLRRSDSVYGGQLQVAALEAAGTRPGQGDEEALKRLASLRRWREGFADGMVRTVFQDQVILTYPQSGEIRRAIERMATGRVTHVPNRCARTMREALGWGLGDAHVWAKLLPQRGYVARRDALARPGDILVWPFTYPPRGTQHIGVAVQQNGRLMLLSNLSGRLGTTEMVPGYVAFYRPRGGGISRG